MINDVELLAMVRDEDSNAFALLSERYTPLVKSLISKYSSEFMTREDVEDLEQEAQVMLFKAAKTYDAESGLTFGLYARICINNGLVSLLRKEKGKIERINADLGELELTSPDTTGCVCDEESAGALMNKIKGVLSEKEYAVFGYMILDYRNSQIAKMLGVSVKSVENTVFRIKKKLRVLLL